MDASDEINISQDDIARLSPTDQRDLQQFINQKNQEANVQRTIHEFTQTCFSKCVKKGSIASGSLTSKENTCMSNCVNRFMDSNLAVLKHLEKLRALQ